MFNKKLPRKQFLQIERSEKDFLFRSEIYHTTAKFKVG